MSSPLEQAVEDALLSMMEEHLWIPPPVIEVRYEYKEWKAIETFYQIKIEKGKLTQSNDRHPFIRLRILGVTVNLTHDAIEMDTIH